MTTIQFTDGVTVETDGPMRVLTLADGCYVTGQGFLLPVDDEREAQETIERMEDPNRRIAQKKPRHERGL